MAVTPASLALFSPPLAANDVAFGIIFGIFVLALLTLIVIVLRWAIGRDRQGRAAWRSRQIGGANSTNGDSPVPPGR
jgi:hypothetical protein